MDDKEYYTLMNRSSSWALQQAIKKTRRQNKNPDEPLSQNQTHLPTGTQTYTSLELRQGSADAQMLMEKQT